MRCRKALQEQRGVERQSAGLAEAADQPDEISSGQRLPAHSPPLVHELRESRRAYLAAFARELTSGFSPEGEPDLSGRPLAPSHPRTTSQMLNARDADHALQLAHDGEGALELRQGADLGRKAHEVQLIAALGAHRGDVDLLARHRIAAVP